LSVKRCEHMSDQTPESTPVTSGLSQTPPKTVFKLDNIIAIVLVCFLVAGVGIGVSRLGPAQLPEGRPIGNAGKVQAFAVASRTKGEGFTVWRGDRQVQALTQGVETGFERVELSSNDIDIAGNNAPDLVLYAWTGGAHCCFTQYLIDGQSGTLLGQIELGNSDPTPFLATTHKGLPRAALIGVDDVGAFKFGSYADSPMARIVASWDGKRIGLDLKRMKAASPDGPPAFFINEPELGEAATIGVQEYGEDETTPGETTLTANAQGRGDRTKTYQSWMEGEEARMRATPLVKGNFSSYGPMAAFLNERVYKGQVKAGVATVLAVHKDTPEISRAALGYYFDVLSQSRWFGDLDTLNAGALKELMARYEDANK
jgi:hypothetical protein